MGGPLNVGGPGHMSQRPALNPPLLLWPRAGGLNHLPGVFGHRRGSDGSGWLLGISRTTGGWFASGMPEVAAAFGGSVPMSNVTSGNAARGGV